MPFRWERSRTCSILCLPRSPTILSSPSAAPSPLRSGPRRAPAARPDRLTLLRGLVAAFRALADDAPLLLAIDDVQWLDPASARVLSFAVRRIGDEPIGVLATLRGAAGDSRSARARRRVPTGSVRRAHGRTAPQDAPPDGSSASASTVRIPRTKVAAVHAASRGNPMFALEFARAAEREQRILHAPAAGPVVAPGARQRTCSGASERHAAAARARRGDRAPDVGLARSALGAGAEPLVDEAVVRRGDRPRPATVWCASRTPCSQQPCTSACRPDGDAPCTCRRRARRRPRAGGAAPRARDTRRPTRRSQTSSNERPTPRPSAGRPTRRRRSRRRPFGSPRLTTRRHGPAGPSRSPFS